MIIGCRETTRGVVILDLEGKLTVIDGAKSLRAKVSELLSSGKSNILLNCRKLSYIDSTGIGAIVASYSKAYDENGTVKLLGLDPKIEQLLTVMERFDSEDDAIASFED